LIFGDLKKKIVEKIQISLKYVIRITGTLYEHLRTFMIIPDSILLRMTNISDKICRETQCTHFMFNTIFPKIMLSDNVEKDGIARQATYSNVILHNKRCALCAGQLRQEYRPTHTHIIFNIHCFTIY